MLARLNDELFPKEFNDNIEYLPDYSSSAVMNFAPADPRHRLSSSQAVPDTRKTSTF